MRKSRTAQLIYQTIYCTLGVVACVASLGIFDNIPKTPVIHYAMVRHPKD